MEFKKLPGLTWDGTIYQNDDMGVLEALLPTGGFPTAHAPAMLELPDKDCFAAGLQEHMKEVQIFILFVQFFHMARQNGLNLLIFQGIQREVNRIRHYSMDLIMLYGLCIQHS